MKTVGWSWRFYYAKIGRSWQEWIADFRVASEWENRIVDFVGHAVKVSSSVQSLVLTIRNRTVIPNLRRIVVNSRTIMKPATKARKSLSCLFTKRFHNGRPPTPTPPPFHPPLPKETTKKSRRDNTGRSKMTCVNIKLQRYEVMIRMCWNLSKSSKITKIKLRRSRLCGVSCDRCWFRKGRKTPFCDRYDIHNGSNSNGQSNVERKTFCCCAYCPTSKNSIAKTSIKVIRNSLIAFALATNIVGNVNSTPTNKFNRKVKMCVLMWQVMWSGVAYAGPL